MDKSFELKFHYFEENYWWFIARRDVVIRLLEKYNKKSAILEIGCSGGPLIKALNEKGFNNVYGIDISKEAIDLCKKKGINNVFIMNGKNTRFMDEKFDIIIASDVLEHIKNDNAALKEWGRLLRPGGKLIVFVPAFNFLWSSHDEVAYHYRRYTKKSLSTALKNTVFNIEKISYWNVISFFPAAFIRILQRYYKNDNQKDQLHELNPSINKVILNFLKFENFLLTKMNFPLGLSVFAIAVKQQVK